MARNQVELNYAELAKLVHETYLEQYRALRNEINLRYDAEQKMNEIALAGAGLLIGGSPFIIQTNSGFIFAVISFVFYFITWKQIHNIGMIGNLSMYIRHSIHPRICETLSMLDPMNKSAADQVIFWEDKGQRGNYWKGFIFLPVAATRIGIPFLAAVFSFCVYLIVIYPSGQLFSPVNIGLLVANICFLVYTITIALITRRIVQKISSSK